MKKSTSKTPVKTTTKKNTPRPRGFAAMDPDLQRSIASQGGKAVSKNRKYMANLGRLGGLNSHKNTNSKGN